MAVEVILTMASVGSWILGSATLSMRTSSMPCQVRAFIPASSSPSVAQTERRWPGRGPVTAVRRCWGVALRRSAAHVAGRVVRHVLVDGVLRVDTGRRPGVGTAVGAVGPRGALVGVAAGLSPLFLDDVLPAPRRAL